MTPGILATALLLILGRGDTPVKGPAPGSSPVASSQELDPKLPASTFVLPRPEGARQVDFR
jgi:hypothetical protein